MKNIFILIFTLFFSFSSAQDKWTLEMSVKRAIDENISIKQSELDYVDSEINRKNAVGNFIPNINIGSSHSWNVGLNQNITTGLLLSLIHI